MLQVCVDTGSTSDETLVALLFISPNTVHVYFNRVFELLDVHSRSAAIIVALKNRWILLPPVGIVN